MDEPQRRLGAATCVLALLCGVWAMWPVMAPAPAVPSVTHQPLPRVGAALAAEYPRTASISPLISGRLNLNSASQEQLEALPGVGPALARRLQAGRPYRSLADLDAVRGVGPKLLEQLTPLVAF